MGIPTFGGGSPVMTSLPPPPRSPILGGPQFLGEGGGGKQSPFSGVSRFPIGGGGSPIVGVHLISYPPPPFGGLPNSWRGEGEGRQGSPFLGSPCFQPPPPPPFPGKIIINKCEKQGKMGIKRAKKGNSSGKTTPPPQMSVYDTETPGMAPPPPKPRPHRSPASNHAPFHWDPPHVEPRPPSKSHAPKSFSPAPFPETHPLICRPSLIPTAPPPPM